MSHDAIRDLTVDPDEEFEMDREALHAKNRLREDREQTPSTIDTTLDDIRDAIREEL
jgi:hypothetical protein